MGYRGRKSTVRHRRRKDAADGGLRCLTSESVVRQEQVMRMMREHGAGGVILCPALDTRAEHLDWAQNAETSLLN
jgi:hypothetical protein